MTIQEYSGFIKYKDAEGNIMVLLPITTVDNINGIDGIYTSIGQSIKYIPQTLTEEEKTQARDNIGALSSEYMPVCVTQAEYNALVAEGNIVDTTPYLICEEQ